MDEITNFRLRSHQTDPPLQLGLQTAETVTAGPNGADDQASEGQEIRCHGLNNRLLLIIDLVR